MTNIIFYSKTGCPWGDDAREFLVSNKISFEERNMTENIEFRIECENKSGQSKCPTFDIEGHILPDSDVNQLSKYLDNLS